MTDQPRWLQKLTRLARPTRQDTTPERHTEAAQTSQQAAPAADYEAGRIDLGGGAVLYMPAGHESARLQGQDSESDEARRRIGDLVSRADRAEFDAERLDDADLPEQAASLRRQAAQLRNQAHRDEALSWIEAGGVDLGHAELLARIYDRANAAYFAGDSAGWWQLNLVAERLEEDCNDHEKAAIQTAVTLPDPATRQAYLDSKQDEIRRQAQELVERYCDDLDLTVPVAVSGDAWQGILAESQQLKHMDRIDNDVRDAYHKALDQARETDAGARWLYLTQVREELAHQARRDGHEPHTKEDVDAALQRLTHSEQFTAIVIPEDAEHMLTDEHREAAVRFGGADRHMIHIDYPEHDQPDAEQADDHDAASSSAEQADDAAEDDAEEFEEKCAEEHFEDSMEHGATLHYGDLDEGADDIDTPVRAELRGKDDRGEPLTDADKATEERADDHSTVRDDTDDLGDLDDLDDVVEDQSETVEQADAATATATDAEAAEVVGESVEVAAQQRPAARTETTACAVVVSRAQVTVDRARQRLVTAQQQESAADRDAELAQWHADDTAARIDAEQVADTTAVQGSGPAYGG